MKITTVRPVRLLSGNWGIRSEGTPIKKGETIEVKTRYGKKWKAVVDKIVWHDEENKIWVAATRRQERKTA